MSGSEKRIRVIIDPAAARTGATQINAALASINGQGLNNLAGSSNNATQAFTRTGAQARNMAAGMSAANNNTRGLSAGFANLAQNLTGGSRAAGMMTGAMGAMGGAMAAVAPLLLVGGIVALGAAIFSATAQVQTFKASLTTVIGDAEKAGLAFDQLAGFASKTPFSIDQAINGFVKLKALGLTPSEEAMMSYGNTAAAMGKDLNQMVEAVADATTGEFERLKEFGIKSKSEGDKVSFTFQGITTTVGKNASEIEQYLQGIGNVQFAGAMERQSKTIQGAFSNLKDQIFLTFADMGEGGLGDLFRNVLDGLATGLATVRPLLKAISGLFGGLIEIAKSLWSGVSELFSAFAGGGEKSISITEGLTIWFNILGEVANVVGGGISAAFTAIASAVGKVRDWISGAWTSLLEWLGISTGQTTQGMGASFVGIVRAVSFVAGQIPKLFAAAFNDVLNMGQKLGGAIAKALTGDFSGFGQAFSGAFSGSAAAFSETISGAMARFNDKGNQATFDRFAGRDGGSGIDLGSLGGTATPSGSSGAGAGKGAGSEAAKAAEAMSKAREDYAEFIASMGEEIKLAGMLRHEAEEYKAVLEAKDILGKAFTEIQEQEVRNLHRQKVASEAIGSIKQDTFDLAQENALSEKLIGSLMSDQSGYAEDILALRKGIVSQTGDLASISTDEYQAAEQAYLLELQKNDAIRERLNLKREEYELGKDLFRDAGVPLAGTAASAAYERDRSLAALSTVVRPADMSADDFEKQMREANKRVVDEYDDAMQDIANQFHDNMVSAIYQIGDAVGGTFGDIINGLGTVLDRINAMQNGDWSQGGVLGGIASLFGGPQGNRNPFGDAVQEGIDGFGKQMGDVLKDPLGSISDSFSGLKDAFKSGGITGGLGQALGSAMQGAAVGSAVAGLGQLFWDKFSETGAQLGGAVGGIIGGPVGSIIGAIGGGILGGLLTKSNRAMQTFAVEEGRLALGTLYDPAGADQSKAAQAAGSSVVDIINSIADKVGGTIAGVSLASIGMRGEDYRVDPAGTGNTKLQYGVLDFGEDQEAAIKYVINDALKKGIIDGLSDFGARAMKNATTDTIDSVVSVIESFEVLSSELDGLSNPIMAGISAINDPLDDLADSMRAFGATALDLAKVEEYRALKLEEYTNDALSSLNNFRDDLIGRQGGETALSVLTRDLADFEVFKSDIAAGKTVDQDAFTSLGQAILGGASEVFGSTSAFTDIRDMLFDATNGLIANTETSINDATTLAIQEQTDAVTGQIGITNDLLRQLIEQGGTISPLGIPIAALAGGRGSVNGSQVQAY